MKKFFVLLAAVAVLVAPATYAAEARPMMEAQTKIGGKLELWDANCPQFSGRLARATAEEREEVLGCWQYTNDRKIKVVWFNRNFELLTRTYDISRFKKL
jgi:hypothetical protein